jgi:hypothetical protein
VNHALQLGAHVKAATEAPSQLISIAMDLFPATRLNPHRGKEFRSTHVPIVLESEHS